MTPITSFLPLVRGPLPGCPDMILADAVRAACVEFCQRTRCLTERVALETVVGQAAYTLMPTLGQYWEVYELRSADEVLTPASRVDLLDAGLLAVTGSPRCYYVEGTGQVVLAPVPDGILPLTITVTVRPDDESEEVDDALWQDYREAIASGARAWVRRHYGEWLNKPLEGDDRGLFELAIQRANLRRARGGTTLPLRVRSHSF